MNRWIVAVAVVLAAGLIGTGVWGYQENQQKNAITTQAENHYQRAFHELSYHMDLLHEKIGTALAMNSKTSLTPQMLDIWRLTSEAQSNLGQLPLAQLPFNKTEEFLSNIGDFTYRTAARDLDKTPLTDKESKTLQSLHGQSAEIMKELRTVQNKVLHGNLKWMDAELALKEQDEKADNTIMDGFRTVEKKVSGYDESNTSTSLINNSAKEHSYKNISGKKISEAEALKKAYRILKDHDKKAFTIKKSGKGSDITVYNITYQKGSRNAQIDLTEKGGKPLNILLNRPVDKRKLSLYDAKLKAEQYLKTNGFQNMEVINSTQYDNIGVFSFLYREGDVYVYSDSIEVKVALDNGEVLGLSARDYYMNHHDRNIPKPKVSLEDAKAKVNPNVAIQTDRLAIIDDEMGKEVLVYEFLGTYEGSTFRIFINASDGTEEKVERLEGTESSV